MNSPKKVILSVAAHGDDAEFMAGGTLAKMVDEGHELYLLIATDNDRGSYRLSASELKAIARPEAEESARVLGAQGVFLLGYQDGDLGSIPTSTLRGQIMYFIRKLQAEMIFCWDPFAPFENHPDHRALALAASDASSFSSMPLFHPEQLAEGLLPKRVTEWYWYSKSHWETNRRVDISATIERKIQALYAYNCQMVLTIDDILGEARAMGVDEVSLAGIDTKSFEPLIDLGVRLNDAKIGAGLGCDYAEAFRYQTIELPEIFQSQGAAMDTLSPKKLPFGRIALYSMASAGLNILAITIDTWLVYFYAPPPDSGRPQYLPIALIGVLLTVASLWDAVIDPFIGHASDTMRNRWGRRKPFLALAAPFVLVGAVLLWTPLGKTVFITAIYFMVINLLYRTAYSLVGIPYDATLPEMAPESKARVGLSYWKSVFGIVGVLIGSLVAAPLFQSIGAVYMGIVVGLVGVVTIYMTLLGLRETRRPLGEPMRAIEGLKATFQNKQFIIVFISTLFVHVCYQMLLINFPYFVTLVLGKSEGDVGIYQGVLILVMAITGPAWMALNRRHTQRWLLNFSMLGLALMVALGFLVGSTTRISLDVQAYLLVILIGATLGGYLIVIYALMGNVADYDEMLTGRRREAIYYGTFSFAIGLGGSLGSLVLPMLYKTFGYTHANPLGVRLAFLVMALFVVIGFFIFQKYRLGDTPEETRKNMGLES